MYAGPSTAVALTVLQPPTTGKTLGSRPAFKGMLRSKVPSMCAMGSFFRWMVVRFAVKNEPIPRAGSAKLKHFYLWPGRAGDHSREQLMYGYLPCSMKSHQTIIFFLISGVFFSATAGRL